MTSIAALNSLYSPQAIGQSSALANANGTEGDRFGDAFFLDLSASAFSSSVPASPVSAIAGTQNTPFLLASTASPSSATSSSATPSDATPSDAVSLEAAADPTAAQDAIAPVQSNGFTIVTNPLSRFLQALDSALANANSIIGAGTSKASFF